MTEDTFHHLFNQLSHKGEDALKDFLHKAHKEIDETKEAGLILKRYAKGHDISLEEKETVRIVFYDMIKIAGIGIPFTLVPGSSLILPFFVYAAKKYNINILPSAFSEEKEK